eukprot:239233_1
MSQSSAQTTRTHHANSYIKHTAFCSIFHLKIERYNCMQIHSTFYCLFCFVLFSDIKYCAQSQRNQNQICSPYRALYFAISFFSVCNYVQKWFISSAKTTMHNALPQHLQNLDHIEQNHRLWLLISPRIKLKR